MRGEIRLDPAEGHAMLLRLKVAGLPGRPARPTRSGSLRGDICARVAGAAR